LQGPFVVKEHGGATHALFRCLHKFAVRTKLSNEADDLQVSCESAFN
jgi:hypothetical protein